MHSKVQPQILDVLVVDGKIVQLEESISSSEFIVNTYIDGSGKFLIPGLIDGHTHLSGVPGMRYDQASKVPDIERQALEQFPRSYLFHGFTTVVDLNAHRDFIDRWNNYDIRPKAYFCAAAPIKDGYPTNSIPKDIRYDVFPNFLVEHNSQDIINKDVDKLQHSPQVVVNRIKSSGAICVKTHFEKGFGARDNLPTPSAELIKQLVEQSHKQNMPVLMHANSQEAHEFASQVSVDAITHGMWMFDANSNSKLTYDVKTILDTIIHKDIGWQPTIQVLLGERKLFNPDYLASKEIKNVLPESLLNWYETHDGQWFKQSYLQYAIVAKLVKEGNWEKLNELPLKRLNATLNYMFRNGGKLLFGSDTPSDATFANPPGLNGFNEMLRWQQAGVPAPIILHSATYANAKFFNLSHLGSIEVGKQADLLLLSDNPFKDITALNSIELIIHAGKIIKREDLSAQNH